MPHIDGRTGEIVIRIVYDGAPEAGKTTNVEQLTQMIALQRRGQTATPGDGEPGGRTEFFDWLDFTGGYVDGRRVRCQLVTVPGQTRLLHRRKYLLERADVVVFVVDSRRAQVEEAIASVSTTRKIVAELAGGDVSVVVQANKQDHAGALPPEEVVRVLGLAEATTAVGSVASSGNGVMETFVLAVRVATERVRGFSFESLKELPASERTPDALHHAMRSIEEAKRRKEEAEQNARVESERKAREESERKAREEAERKAREEAERKAREESERKAREESERKAREESERKAREESERKAREESERKAREESERKAREESERKAREESERKAREEAERKAREESERKAREESERKAREESERKARELQERDAAERTARERARREDPEPESGGDLDWSMPPAAAAEEEIDEIVEVVAVAARPPKKTEAPAPAAPRDRVIRPVERAERDPTPAAPVAKAKPADEAIPLVPAVDTALAGRAAMTTTAAPGFWAWLKRLLASIFGGGR